MRFKTNNKEGGEREIFEVCAGEQPIARPTCNNVHEGGRAASHRAMLKSWPSAVALMADTCSGSDFDTFLILYEDEGSAYNDTHKLARFHFVIDSRTSSPKHIIHIDQTVS